MAAVVGPGAVLGFGAAWAVGGTLVVLAVPAVRRVAWLEDQGSGPLGRGPCSAASGR